MRTCVLFLVCPLPRVFVFYLVSLFSFQLFLMSTSALNERSMSNPLCDFRLGTVVTSDYETPLTFFEGRTRDRMSLARISAILELVCVLFITWFLVVSQR